jgi:hypothetical protein
LHPPDRPAARARDILLTQLPERLACIHGYDARAATQPTEPRGPAQVECVVGLQFYQAW